MALTTFSDLVQEARERVKRDALAAGLPDDGKPLRDGGTGATAYADAVAVYLGICVDKAADYRTALCALGMPTDERVATLFARQAIPMTWDFAEANPFGDVGGDFCSIVSNASRRCSGRVAGSCAWVCAAS